MSSDKVKYIRPKGSRLEFAFREIWEYRELLYFLVWKQIKTKYKQTAMGIGWAVLQPLLSMIIFTVIFSTLANIPTEGIPYAAFIYTTLILWTFFSTTLASGSMSMVSNANMISKIYFPRILLPLSLVIAGLLDYAIAFGLLIVLMLALSIPFTLWMVLIFIPLALTVVLSAGICFWLSALSANYRDVQYITPFFIQLLLFASPIIYSWNNVTNYRWILEWNPLAGIMSMQRYLTFGHPMVPDALLITSTIICTLIFFGGMFYFKHYERQLADVI
ncbi:MAG: ABC transporter permease [Methanomassiliicoccales archaeon]